MSGLRAVSDSDDFDQRCLRQRRVSHMCCPGHVGMDGVWLGSVPVISGFYTISYLQSTAQ